MLGGIFTSITTPSAARNLITNRFLAEHKRNGYGTYLVSLRPETLDDEESFEATLAGSELVGTVSLMRGEGSPVLAPDLGFAMLSQHMRKGYAVEAV